MIKVKNYITITMVIAVLFFLFISQSIMKPRLSDKGTNHYSLTLVKKEKKKASETDQRKRIFFAGKDNDEKRQARQYASFRNYRLKTSESFRAASAAAGENDVILVDGDIFTENDIVCLKKSLEKKMTVIFLTMPDDKLISASEDLREMLGIQRSRGRVKPAGYQLFGGFLLGGEGYYVETEKPKHGEKSRQDLPSEITYYEVASSSRLYMIAQLRDKDRRDFKDLDKDNTNLKDQFDSEDYPAVIWQHALHSGRVFCVNIPVMKTDTAAGILMAMEYSSAKVMVSQFTDVRSLVTSSYPLFSDENETEMQRLYGMSTKDFETNVVWPFLVSVASENNDRLTLMGADHLESGSGNYKNLDTYLSLIENQRAELGAKSEDATDIRAGLDKYFPNYRLNCFYGKPKKGLTVTTGDKAAVFLQKGSRLIVKTTEEADQMSYSDDLRLKSLVTATGFYLTDIDLSKAFYPEKKADRYEKFSKRVAGNLNSWYTNFRYLNALTLSEAGSRISEFLNTDFTVKIEGNRVEIEMNSQASDSSKLMLRTHGQDIKSISGAEYEEAEDDAYVLTVHGRKAVVELEDRDRP